LGKSEKSQAEISISGKGICGEKGGRGKGPRGAKRNWVVEPEISIGGNLLES